jgi:YcxB-like protein
VAADDNLLVTVTLTQNDYAKALSALASPKASLAKRVLFWISVAFLGYLLFSVISISDNWPYRVVFIVIVVAIVAALTKYALPYWAARSFVRKNPDKLGPSRHEIGSAGTSYQSVHGEGKLAWTAFHQIRETPDLFLLYTQSNFAQIVP